MFKLNFKENIKDLVKDQIEELVDEAIDKKVEEVVVKKEEETSNQTLLQTDKYLELIELINLNSKAAIVTLPQSKTNLFSAKSVITVAAFLVTSVLAQVDNALIDKKISYKEGLAISIALIGAMGTVAARGAEGKTGVYTPDYMYGLNKEDYNNDGVVDELDINA
jgi:hypothetical protein